MMNYEPTPESVLTSVLKAVELSEQTYSLAQHIVEESKISSEARPFNPSSVFFIIKEEVKDVGEKPI